MSCLVSVFQKNRLVRMVLGSRRTVPQASAPKDSVHFHTDSTTSSPSHHIHRCRFTSIGIPRPSHPSVSPHIHRHPSSITMITVFISHIMYV